MKHEASKINNSFKSRGFTMIELLVAISVFLIVIAIATTIFVNALRTQRATIALMNVNDNASLALEQMARELRTGSNFSSVASQINFTNAKGEAVTYRRNATTGVLERGVGDSFSAFTADNVNVKRFSIVLKGNVAGDGLAPQITIALSVAGRLKELQDVTVNLQTTVSARNIDT